ncbi:MAG: hypothetical protein KAI66_03590 [Lentisphaeria bacterium]|nr:hypothetical protein [Lentisphaeria bacterium]
MIHSNSMDLLVGYARRDISPSIGDPHMIGCTIERILKPVYVRVICIEEPNGDEGPFLLAMADHAGFDKISDRLAREAMAKATGVEFERIRINGSHNHTCPEASRADQQLLDERGLKHVSVQWLNTVDGLLADAAREAVRCKRPASAWCGSTPVHGIAANRVIKHPGDDATMRLGAYRPDDAQMKSSYTEGALGLIDPDAHVLCFKGEDGRPIATVVNYACHVTALGTRGWGVHPDFPGIAMDIIEAETGGPGFFLQGCGGNVGTGKFSDGSMEAVERMGQSLGGSVVAAMDALKPCASAPLHFTSWQERIALREDLPSADQLHEQMMQASANSLAWQEASMLRVVSDPEAARTCDLFLLEAGDWCLAGMPGESFVEQQLAIRGASPKPFSFVAGYFDMTLWYIPSYDRIRSGGYEATGNWNYTAPGACEQLSASVIRRLWGNKC